MFAARNMLFAGSSAFDPLSLSPALWLDGSDASTLYDATTGGSLVAPSGAVARCEDKSGNGWHVTQATLGSRPLRIANALNGKDVLRFDGGDSLFASVAIAYNGASIFAVWRRRAGTTAAMGLFEHNIFPTRLFNLYSANATSIRFEASGTATGTVSTTRTVAAGNFYLTSGILSSVGNAQHFLNGGSEANHSTVFFNTLAPANLVVGTYAGGWDGDIAEILVFPTALSTTDRQQVENYLNAKWAIY